MSTKSKTRGSEDILIDSNWINTIGLAVLFLFTAFLLGWSIRGLLLDKFDRPSLPTGVVGTIYFCLFAYSFPAKHLKLAFSLLASRYTVLLAMTTLHVSGGVQHSVAVAGSFAEQLALIIILVSIAQWFRTVIRQTPPIDPGVTGS